MRQRLPDWLKFPVVLAVVTTISAVCLAGLWTLTLPQKELIQTEITERALEVVMPGADKFEKKDTRVNGRPFSYRIAKKDGQIIGYVLQGEATGYSSVLKVMLGVDTNFSILGIKVLSQKETPGLGDKVDEIRSKKTWGTVLAGTNPDESRLRPWFQVQFNGKKAPVRVDKDGGTIEAVTGATISSRAVCNAVDEAISDLRRVVR